MHLFEDTLVAEVEVECLNLFPYLCRILTVEADCHVVDASAIPRTVAVERRARVVVPKPGGVGFVLWHAELVTPLLHRKGHSALGDVLPLIGVRVFARHHELVACTRR